MAAATSIILAGTALASTGLGVAKSVKEAKQAREAKKNIDNYQRQEIDFNNYLMAVDTPTDQYVQQLKRVQQESANYSEQASSAGARGLSLLPGIQEQTYAQEEQLAANFQNQLYELQKQQAIMAAEQENREFQARENREQRELRRVRCLVRGRKTGSIRRDGGSSRRCSSDSRNGVRMESWRRWNDHNYAHSHQPDQLGGDGNEQERGY